MITIRKANKNDFEQFYLLNVDYAKELNRIPKIDALKYKLIKKEFKKFFIKEINDKNRTIFVMDDGNNLQGFLSTVINQWSGWGYKFNQDKSGFIVDVFITKKYRKKGYFSELLNIYFGYLKNKKIVYCTLTTDLNNKKAIKVYEKFKFKMLRCNFFRKI